jgi:hypothetical protein
LITPVPGQQQARDFSRAGKIHGLMSASADSAIFRPGEPILQVQRRFREAGDSWEPQTTPL